MADQRIAPRRLFMCRADLAWSCDGQSKKLSGMVEDRSKSGLGIQVPKSVPVGTQMTIQFNNEIHSAIVKRCIRSELGFFIGVAFAGESREAAGA